MEIAIVLICLLMSAYFSATETAFSTFNRIRLKNAAEKGDKKAAMVLDLAEDYDRLISAILIGNNIVNILAASMATLFFQRVVFSGDISKSELAATISTAVLTIIVLVFGEVSPKTIAKNSPDKFAMFSAPIMKVIKKIFSPLTFIFQKWQSLLAKIFKPEEDTGMTEEELISIIEEAEEDGEIDEEESTLIKSASKCANTTLQKKRREVFNTLSTLFEREIIFDICHLHRVFSGNFRSEKRLSPHALPPPSQRNVARGCGCS